MPPTIDWLPTLVDQELETGIRSIAAPLHSADGRVIAAVNVSSTTSSASLRQLSGEYRDALLETAAHIDLDLARLR